MAVSKSVFDKIVNHTNFLFNFTVGYVKCNVVPEDATSLAVDTIRGIRPNSMRIYGLEQEITPGSVNFHRFIYLVV